MGCRSKHERGEKIGEGKGRMKIRGGSVVGGRSEVKGRGKENSV